MSTATKVKVEMVNDGDKMTYEQTAKKVIALLIKRGHNAERAKELVDRELTSAMKAYPEAKPATLATVVTY